MSYLTTRVTCLLCGQPAVPGRSRCDQCLQHPPARVLEPQADPGPLMKAYPWSLRVRSEMAYREAMTERPHE
jgi:hypothetical protein